MIDPIKLVHQAELCRQKGIDKSKMSRMVQSGKLQPYKIKKIKTLFYNPADEN